MKHTAIWLPAYLRSRLIHSSGVRPTHVMFCLVDHFEPDWNHATLDEQLARVERWAAAYPALAARHRDADGCHPRHSFFYPAEVYQPAVAERLARLCRDGFGEVEMHLHHDGDTSETLAKRLERAKTDFARHGLLARDRSTGAVRFGFIHGNWALDNARRDGKWCGVNNELSLLHALGCYADFTLPSAPSETQTRKINSLYYALDDPRAPKSHDTGCDVRVGRAPNGELLIVQGPLTLNWRRRKYGLLPRIENGELSASNPPSPERVDLWIRASIHVVGREEWVFVKVHTHGAKPSNAEALLGGSLEAMWTSLETRSTAARAFRLHYVTAREMYNIIKAAERGESGDPGSYRSYELIRDGDA
ncbi:MAG: hypothetical protein HYZ91_00880 [Candidatus Omnitrophica bacterium]|nr:hypothetical protein [Candidatus Omnitrophota bacterium]